MKFRTTLILLAVFAGLLALVLLFDSKGEKKKAAEERANMLISLTSGDIRKASLARDGETLTFERDEAGPWRLTSPLQAAADDYEVDNFIDSLASLRIARVVEKEAKDLAAYEIPKMEVSVWVKGNDTPVRLLIGMENPLDKTLFAKREDDPRVVLLASTLKTTLDKKVFDFRQKDVFKFIAADVKTVRVKTKDVSWQAAREETGWFLKAPVASLAAEGKIDALLDSLSGLRAKEFVAEDKNADVLKKYGLEKPEYEVALSLPTSNQEIIFVLRKEGEVSYATTSLSTKVIAFEGALLSDLDRNVDELREKKVADFSSWDAVKVAFRKDGFDLAAVKQKVGEEDKWLLDPATKEEADRTRVEDFIRKVEGLEAAAFIDNPGPLAAYGLDGGTEVRIGTKDYQNKEKEIVLLIGKEDAEKKQVVVKNAQLDYLFRVDSAFLQDLPKETKDWKAEPPKPEEEKTDKK
ncbi:MAG: hypothetical protein A2V76_11170 [Candidatus Aminicenantes bacterium RBG_16_63_14]|nr:MAG: hypothetical protein A2V76_11170 [Candidatus Aminicenantes bacterium RBG_16_63_14]